MTSHYEIRIRLTRDPNLSLPGQWTETALLKAVRDAVDASLVIPGSTYPEYRFGPVEIIEQEEETP